MFLTWLTAIGAVSPRAPVAALDSVAIGAGCFQAARHHTTPCALNARAQRAPELAISLKKGASALPVGDVSVW
jgi:hypothetical protein